jgi:alpha-1,3-mannosyltransferase
MRVVHVVRQFHPSVGGLETVVLELACAQLAHGHEVRVVTLDRLFNSNSQTPLVSRDAVHGIEVIRIPFHGSTRYPIAPSVLKFITSADIVHVHAIDFFFDYLAWTRPLHRKPIVASTHGAFFHTSFAQALKRIYFSVITRLSAAWYDRIVAVSAADHELFSKISSNVECIENGVNVQRFLGASALNPVKKMIMVGRFSNNKRLDRLISFVSKLRAHDPGWALVIAGRHSDLGVDDLTLQIERAGCLNAVSIIESPSDNNLRKIMNDCSVIVSASEYEGFGLTAIEGMAAGLFPLLSDIPPFRSLISKTGVGMLVDFSNSEEASIKFIQQWEKISKNYERVRVSAINWAQQYDWAPVSTSYEKLYDKVLAAKNRN